MKCLIKLLGVLGEGGIIVKIKSFADILNERLLICLVEAIRALSSVIGRSEVRKLELNGDKLIVVESKKKYVVVALTDSAEEYIESLLKIIAEEIDRSDIKMFDGLVDNRLSDRIGRILDMYIESSLKPNIMDILTDIWDPILEAINLNPKLSELINRIDRAIYESTENFKKKWFRLKKGVSKISESAIKSAFNCDFETACALSIDSRDVVEKMFGIKMGLLSASMIAKASPALDELKNLTDELPQDNIFANFISQAVRFRDQSISLLDYIQAFRKAISHFKFEDKKETLFLSFLFVDSPLRFFPEFSTRLEKYFRPRSKAISTYIGSIIERHNIIKKIYSITKYDEIKDEINRWQGKIRMTFKALNKILSATSNSYGSLATRNTKVDTETLIASINIDTYLLLLSMLLLSPVLNLRERRKISRRILHIYSKYFRPILRKKIPIFASTCVSVFQSVAVAVTILTQTSTMEDKLRYTKQIQDILKDVLDIITSENPKIGISFPFITTTTAFISPILTSLNEFYEEELGIIYTVMKVLDVRLIESWKRVLPYNFAAFATNLVVTLAALALKLLKYEKRVLVVRKCINILADIYKWLLSQGKISREAITTFSFYVSSIMEEIDPIELEYFTRLVLCLCKIAVIDFEKYADEFALIGESIVELLIKAGKILGKEEYIQYAKQIVGSIIKTWERYGFHKKALELKKRYREPKTTTRNKNLSQII